MKSYIGILFFCLLLLRLQAQDSSRMITPSVKYTYESDFDKNVQSHTLDTSLGFVQRFHNYYNRYIVYQDLGNIGTAGQSLVFNQNRPLGFALFSNPFDGLFMHSEEEKYYNVKSPYSDLFYTQGSNELIYLKAKHYQNILPRWNIGVDFQRITSLGFFTRQNTSLYNYSFNTNYASRNKRYLLLAHATWNRGVVEDNGGVKNDSAFEALTGPNKRVTPNLVSSQTRIKNRELLLKQYIRFGQSKTLMTAKDTIYDFQQKSQLSHTFRLTEESYIFETKSDTFSKVIPARYYDTTFATLDSMYMGKMENKLGFDIFTTTQKQLSDSIHNSLNVALSHTFIAVSQNPYIRNFQNLAASIHFEHNEMKPYTHSYIASLSYGVSGYNAGDYKCNAGYTYRFKHSKVQADVQAQLFRPDFAFQLFKSNQFLWQNQFTKSQYYSGSVTYSHTSDFLLKVSASSVGGYVYLAKNSMPDQASQQIAVYSAEVAKTFHWWKFHFYHHLMYQKTSSAILPLPEMSGNISYWFGSRIRTFRFRIGVDAYYFTSFKAQDYNPALRMFFLQDSKAIGNYPLIEPYISGELKRVTCFAKYEHLNQDWFGNARAYATPSYPLSLASFRMGLRWRFYD